MNRRRFLETLAAGLCLTGCAIPVQRSMPGPSSIPVEKDADGLTPLARFFVTAIVSAPPKIDVANDRLVIDGAVDHPYSLEYDALAQMPQQTQRSVLQCVGGVRGTADWQGVALRRILEQAGIQAGARKVVFYAADGYESSIPVATALKSDSLLVLWMNAEPLRPFHGSPVRLALPGIYGYKQVKWITRIEVVTYNHKGYWEQRGYSDNGVI